MKLSLALNLLLSLGVSAEKTTDLFANNAGGNAPSDAVLDNSSPDDPPVLALRGGAGGLVAADSNAGLSQVKVRMQIIHPIRTSDQRHSLYSYLTTKNCCCRFYNKRLIVFSLYHLCRVWPSRALVRACTI